jgi:glyoxylase-like metal-dependent hydrolase (beta-lactamase superfamily II)
VFEITKICSEEFTSNVYLISSSNTDAVYLIDCGAYNDVLKHIKSNQYLKAIFITHYHYDHIYFIKEWRLRFPEVKVFGSNQTFNGLGNSKLNLSFYHEDPIEVNISDFGILKNDEGVQLFEDLQIEAIETEGHCEGSLTYILRNNFFTGDALIPNIPIVTKLRTGNKDLAKESAKKIKTLATNDSVIYPGHLEPINYQDIYWDIYF